MGDDHARSWTVRGQAGSQHASKLRVIVERRAQFMPAATHMWALQRQVGFSTART
jgi:hypothetical protein